MGILHCGEPDYGTVQVELVEEAVDMLGSLLLEFQEYLKAHVLGEGNGADDEASLPQLLVPEQSQNNGLTTSRARSVAAYDMNEFIEELSTQVTSTSLNLDDTSTSNDASGCLSQLHTVCSSDVVRAAAEAQRARRVEAGDIDQETPAEVALADQLVEELGEKSNREIAARMIRAVHDPVANANHDLRPKSPACVQKWLTKREQQRKRDATLGAANEEELIQIRRLRRSLDDIPSPVMRPMQPLTAAIPDAVMGLLPLVPWELQSLVALNLPKSNFRVV
ncbi:hypothetical protein CYMTET_30944 [Cymbomonas tetramitiformis]|uniref:Uncharacterized protein n=1 Tax=Cymbomonas tetramitiformis TaxID=36881 RepID=A0AAE0FIH2_9CHLO|nr:hypothetical protein CYMTET_30944 [Cymbomonas tetramitiformis]